MNATRKQWFAKGLKLLSENVGQIDNYRVASLYAIKQSGITSPDYAQLKTVPEYMKWMDFRTEICDELKAVVSISSGELNVDLVACRKLDIAIERSSYQEELVINAIAEITSLRDKLKPKQASKALPDSEVTAYVRQNWHKHDYKISKTERVAAKLPAGSR